MSATWLMYFLWFTSGLAVTTAMAKTMSIRHPLIGARAADEQR